MRCRECGATQTPLWRQGVDGEKNLCNACGMKLQRRQAKEREQALRRASAPQALSGPRARVPARRFFPGEPSAELQEPASSDDSTLQPSVEEPAAVETAPAPQLSQEARLTFPEDVDLLPLLDMEELLDDFSPPGAEDSTPKSPQSSSTAFEPIHQGLEVPMTLAALALSAPSSPSAPAADAQLFDLGLALIARSGLTPSACHLNQLRALVEPHGGAPPAASAGPWAPQGKLVGLPGPSRELSHGCAPWAADSAQPSQLPGRSWLQDKALHAGHLSNSPFARGMYQPDGVSTGWPEGLPRGPQPNPLTGSPVGMGSVSGPGWHAPAQPEVAPGTSPWGTAPWDPLPLASKTSRQLDMEPTPLLPGGLYWDRRPSSDLSHKHPGPQPLSDSLMPSVFTVWASEPMHCPHGEANWLLRVGRALY